MATERQIEANRKNALKSTGPKTEEGKRRASMNAIKNGRYVTRFWKIEGEYAGNLAICNTCGQSQAEICQEEKTCLLQDKLTLAHLKTLRSKNLKHREQIDIAQIAQMDFIYSVKLKEVINNLGAIETYIDDKGNERQRTAVSNEDMIVLMNFANHLQKNLKAMQLTRESQDISDVAWAELATAQINKEEAEKARQAILDGIAAYKESQGKAKDMEELDEAIREFRLGEGKSKHSDDSPKLINPPANPFGHGRG